MTTLVQILAKSRVLAFGRADLPSVDATGKIPDQFVWMPAGRHAIDAGTLDGKGFQGEIVCDEQAARTIAASLNEITGTGQRVWLDLNHDDAAAAAWVNSFSWDPAQGIIAHVDWTTRGESAIRGKEYYSFSPAFEAEGKTGRITGLLAGHAAGGLVNAPAFGSAMPALIAARLGGDSHAKTKPAPGGSPEQQQQMKDILIKLLAALKITPPADATEDQLVALVAKHSIDGATTADTQIKALKTELETVQVAAKKAVKDATEATAEVAKKNAENAEVLARKLNEVEAVQAAYLAGAGSRISVTTSVNDALVAYQDRDPAILAFDKAHMHARGELANERARIFARDIAPKLKGRSKGEIISIVAEAGKTIGKLFKVQAANNLGTLSGALVAQQALAFLKFELPMLLKITADFSMENAKLNQQIITRTISQPAVASYSAVNGYQAVASTDVDVPVTINQHRYCQVQFNANELASTNRDLFAEQSTAGIYSLAEDLVLAAYALFTTANYSNGAGKTVQALVGFNRSTGPLAIAQALFLRKVPRIGRSLILNAPYYAQLMSDSAIVSYEAFQFGKGIEEYTLPRIADFDIIQAPDLPGNAINLTGIGFVKEAVVAATRLPYDYVNAQAGSNYGSVSQITDPDTKLSMLLTQYVNHDAGASNWRVAMMYGVAPGDILRAQLLTSA